MNRFYKGDECKKCGKPITINNKSGLCRSCKMIGNKNTLGRKMSLKQREELSINRMGENNPNWKGDNVGIGALHHWVKRRLSKPKLCEKCKKYHPYDLANKGIYNRNFDNWEWLCRKCHMKSDGRFENFIRYSKGKKLSKEHKEKIGLSNKRNTNGNKN